MNMALFPAIQLVLLKMCQCDGCSRVRRSDSVPGVPLAALAAGCSLESQQTSFTPT